MNFPDGRKRTHNHFNLNTRFSNRGMNLETDINVTNQYYLDINKAVVHKKPTPVQVVKVHYPKRSAAVITEGYYKQASTTDYNGVYRHRHLDFEAKETKNKTSFPLHNLKEHQINHMKLIAEHGGICFLIIRFTVHDETYLMPFEKLFPFWQKKIQGTSKSIPYQTIKNECFMIPFKYQARVDYLEVIDQLYF